MPKRNMTKGTVSKRSIVNRVVTHPSIANRLLKRHSVGSEEEGVVDETETRWKSWMLYVKMRFMMHPF